MSVVQQISPASDAGKNDASHAAALAGHAPAAWPLLMLTVLGAWTVALPVAFALAIQLQNELFYGNSGYTTGPIILLITVVAVHVLKRYFLMRQLAAPALVVGLLLLGWPVFRDLDIVVAAGSLALIMLALAVLLPVASLRTMLAVPACIMVALSRLPSGVRWQHLHEYVADGLFDGWIMALAIWLVMLWLRHAVFKRAASAALDAVSAGWCAMMLTGLMLCSGMTFLIQAAMDTSGWIGLLAQRLFGAEDIHVWIGPMALHSMTLALIAAVLLACAWPGVRRGVGGTMALCLIVLAWFLPPLGPVLLILSVCLVTGRHALAIAAALAAAWIVGSFYYQLSWSLLEKGALLSIIGSVLGCVAWHASRQACGSPPTDTVRGQAHVWPAIAIVATMSILLVLVNTAIWNRERLIALGQPVFFQLRVLDPRSLIQGDYMAINVFESEMGFDYNSSSRHYLVATRDARDIGTMLRRHEGEPLAVGEFLIEVHRSNSRLTMASNAWFFREGEAEHWAKARYGEFRVMPGGQVILVDLRGDDLQKL